MAEMLWVDDQEALWINGSTRRLLWGELRKSPTSIQLPARKETCDSSK
jgi:hypothetical protein